jgi:hypothetical protein
MKQVFIVMIMILFFSKSKAEETQSQRTLSLTDQQKIAWALKILEQYKAIDVDENKDIQVDTDILENLIHEGLLKKDDSKLMVICIGQDK